MMIRIFSISDILRHITQQRLDRYHHLLSTWDITEIEFVLIGSILSFYTVNGVKAVGSAPTQEGVQSRHTEMLWKRHPARIRTKPGRFIIHKDVGHIAVVRCVLIVPRLENDTIPSLPRLAIKMRRRDR